VHIHDLFIIQRCNRHHPDFIAWPVCSVLCPVSPYLRRKLRTTMHLIYLITLIASPVSAASFLLPLVPI